MLKNNERTHYMYENKQNMDKVPDQKSDIYVEMTRVCRKSGFVTGKMRVNAVANVIPAQVPRAGSLFRNLSVRWRAALCGSRRKRV
jgi:hypothetical protein